MNLERDKKKPTENNCTTASYSLSNSVKMRSNS